MKLNSQRGKVRLVVYESQPRPDSTATVRRADCNCDHPTRPQPSAPSRLQGSCFLEETLCPAQIAQLLVSNGAHCQRDPER